MTEKQTKILKNLASIIYEANDTILHLQFTVDDKQPYKETMLCAAVNSIRGECDKLCAELGPQNRICGEDCYKPITDRSKCRKALLTWANEEADDDK